MRPEKAHSIVRRVMEQWYGFEDTKPFTYPANFLEAVTKLKQIQINSVLNDEYYSPYEEIEFTTESFDGWRNEMFYISDRFNAFHRVSWLKYGVENKLFI